MVAKMVSWGSSNERPETRDWSKTTKMYSVTVLEAESVTFRGLQGRAPSAGSRESLSLPFPGPRPLSAVLGDPGLSLHRPGLCLSSHVLLPSVPSECGHLSVQAGSDFAHIKLSKTLFIFFMQ